MDKVMGIAMLVFGSLWCVAALDLMVSLNKVDWLALVK